MAAELARQCQAHRQGGPVQRAAGQAGRELGGQAPADSAAGPGSAAQAGQRQLQRAAQLQRGGLAVQPGRQQAGDGGVQRQFAALPAALARHPAGGAVGAGQVQAELFDGQLVGLVGRGPAGQHQARDRHALRIPGAGQAVVKPHAGGGRLVQALGLHLGLTAQISVRPGGQQGGQVQLAGGQRQRTQRPGLEGPQLGAGRQRRPGRRCPPRQWAAGQLQLGLELADRPLQLQLGSPGPRAVALGGQQGLHGHGAGTVDLALRGQAAALPDQRQRVQPVPLAPVQAQGQARGQGRGRRLVIDQQLANGQLVDLQGQRQAQIGRGLQRRTRAAGAAPDHPVGLDRGQVQMHPGARKRTPGRWLQGQPQALHLQPAAGGTGGACRRLPDQLTHLQPAAGQRAVQPLHLQAGHLGQQPGQAGGLGLQPPPQHHRQQGQQGEQRDQHPRPAPPAPQLDGRGGRRAGGVVGWRGRGHQKAMPTEKCRRRRRVSSAQARSTFSGPMGLRQRTPVP